MKMIGVLLPLVIATALMAEDPATQFGASAKTVRSPDGQYALQWQPSPPDSTLPPHLWLAGKQNRVQVLTHDCVAPPSVGWSPDSKFFFVNENQSSDFDNSYLLSVETNPKRLNLYQIVTRKTGRHLQGNAHVYLRSLHWLDNNHVLVRVSGHTDHPPVREFLGCYIADTDGGIVSINGYQCRENADSLHPRLSGFQADEVSP